MIRNIAAISGVAVAFVLVGCVAGSSIRTDRVVISEDDSMLVFYDPKTADLVPTFFKQVASDIYGSDTTIFVGLWRSRSGTFPHARISYMETSPGYYFLSAHDISSYVERLRFGEKGQVKALEKGKQRNLLGPVDYQKFSVGPIQCVAFSQSWDPMVTLSWDRMAGTRRIVGYYCGSQGGSLSDQRIAEIVSAVGVKDEKGPEPLAGWKAAKAGKGIEEGVELPLKARWEGIQENLTGKFLAASTNRSGRIWFALPGKSGECTGEWSHESGEYETPEPHTGSWLLLCTNGMSASGTYVSTEPRKGTGKGKDRNGNAVNFTFGP